MAWYNPTTWGYSKTYPTITNDSYGYNAEIPIDASYNVPEVGNASGGIDWDALGQSINATGGVPDENNMAVNSGGGFDWSQLISMFGGDQRQSGEIGKTIMSMLGGGAQGNVGQQNIQTPQSQSYLQNQLPFQIVSQYPYMRKV